MKRALATLALASLATIASGGDAVVSVAATSNGFLVAHGEPATIEIAGRDGRTRWSTAGVDHPTKIVVSGDGKRAAVLDPLNNQARIVDLAAHSSTLVRTGETPIDGAFAGDALFILDRDARLVERVAADGTKTSLPAPVDSAFLRASADHLYVYGRREGVLVEIGTTPFATQRTASVRPYASDCIIEGGTAYLLYPHDAELVSVSLADLVLKGQRKVGSLPMGMAVLTTVISTVQQAIWAGQEHTIVTTAMIFAVADPPAMRVWTVAAPESPAVTFMRRGSEFPTGVDRVAAAGGTWVAYDTSSGTLYRFSKTKNSVLMKDVPPHGWAVTAEGVAVWAGGRLQVLK